MSWIAVDIGGANLKVSDGRQFAAARPFALWRHPDQLASALGSLLASDLSWQRLAVTMTGELADCFTCRAKGVEHIVAAAREAAGDRAAFVYQTDGQLLAIDDPRRETTLAAASNWHALASFAGRYTAARPAMLVDVGSTTVDLIPLDGGRVVARGATDLDRLIYGELVYTGVERSPICAIVGALPYRDHLVPTAHELFATTVDAYLLLEACPESPRDCETADGRPRTKAAARARLGRTICTELTEGEARRAAAAIRDAQLELLADAWQRAVSALPAPPQCVIVAGHGDDLAERLLGRVACDVECVSLRQELGAAACRSAPAYALAVLAREQQGP